MAILNINQSGSIGSKSNSIIQNGTKIGLVQPFPVFKGDNDLGDLWDASANPPYGLGSLGSINLSFVFNDALYYALYYSNQSTIAGFYKRNFIGTPPTHAVHDSWESHYNLFGIGGYLGRCYFDETSGLVFATIYYTSARIPAVGCWDITDWPFTNGNAKWLSLETTYGSYSAGKIAYYTNFLAVVGNYLLIASRMAGSVLVVNKLTGSLIGEFAYSPSWSANYPFTIVGVDQINGYVVGGANHASAGNGAICRWDISSPSSWSKVDEIVPAGGINTYGVPYKKTIHSLSGAANTNAYITNFSPEEIAHLGLDTDRVIYNQDPYRVDGGGVLVEASLDGAEYYQHMATNSSRLSARSQVAAYENINVVDHNSVKYFCQAGFGSPEIIDKTGMTNPQCLYLHCVDEGSCIINISSSITASTILKSIQLTLPSGSENLNESLHPGKHRFRLRINGGSWTDWRAGYELTQLDQIINGKAAWSSVSGTDTIEIQWQLTSGVIRHFEPEIYSQESTFEREQIVSLLGSGAPKEVEVLLYYDESLPDDGDTRGRKPKAINAEILKPLGLYAEVIS